jgi:group I intron endonuclease
MKGIYQIRCIESKGCYIGSAKDIHIRWRRHKYDLRRGRHHNIRLQRLWDKYKEKSFVFEVLEIADNLFEREQYFIDNRIDLLNIGAVGGGDNISNHPNNKQFRERQRAIQQERRDGLTVEERKLKYGRPGSKNGMFGKTHTSEVRQIISECNKNNKYALGAIRSPEFKKRLSDFGKTRVGKLNPFFGKTHTKEFKKRASDLRRGIPNLKCSKEVSSDGIVYPSLSAAGKTLNVTPSTILNRIRSKNYPNTFYTENNS